LSTELTRMVVSMWVFTHREGLMLSMWACFGPDRDIDGAQGIPYFWKWLLIIIH
jgi:hypothetical protein